MSSIIRMKEWIDGASYEDLLRKWTTAELGDPYFQDGVGDYFKEALVHKGAGMAITAIESVQRKLAGEKEKK